MKLSILTPDKTLFEGEITRVQLPGVEGLFEVLSGHAAMVSALGTGTVSFTTADSQQMTFEVEGGMVEVFNNQVSVLAQSAQ